MIKLKNLITERRSLPLVIIDVQPAYDKWCSNIVPNIIEWIHTNRPPKVIFYFNGEDVGIEDTKEDVMQYFIDHGLDENAAHNITYYEKSYAYIRNWMDADIPTHMIISTLRYMFMNRINDSSDLSEDDFKKIIPDDFEYYYDDLTTDSIYLPHDIENSQIAELNSLRKFYMGGGGKNECLKEIQIFANTLNVKYKLVEKLIY